jgi:hypothetical protein
MIRAFTGQPFSVVYLLVFRSYTPTAPVKAQYDLTTPVPAKRKTVPVAPSKTVHPRDFDELKTTLLQRVTEMFDELANKFFQLDKWVQFIVICLLC